jgi:hypothetical protein
MFGNIEIKDFAPAMFNDKEAIENSECERRDGEEIHGRNDLTMIAQKGGPKSMFLVAWG